MFAEDLYKKILNRNDLADIPILVIAKVTSQALRDSQFRE